jgi:hypothetical protein
MFATGRLMVLHAMVMARRLMMLVVGRSVD